MGMPDEKVHAKNSSKCFLVKNTKNKTWIYIERENFKILKINLNDFRIIIPIESL